MSLRRPQFSLTILLALCSLVATSVHPAAASPNLPSYCTIYVDADATGANNGSSWANAYTSLMTAIKPTNYGCEIWVAEGTYHPDSPSRLGSFFLYDGVAIFGGFDGTEGALSQRDWSSHITILSGEYSGPTTDYYNVVYTNQTGPTAVLDGFTITGGYANGTASGFVNGGGILVEDASPTLSHLIIKNNHADALGGGIYITGNSHPSLRNLTIYNNTAYDGAGVYSDATGTGISLSYATIDNNIAAHSGGGMYIKGTPLTMGWVRFDYNLADFGAGMVIDTVNAATISQSIFGNNQAAEKGGGIYFYDSTASLFNVVFAMNSAHYGGGVGNYNGHPTFTNATFADNTSTYAGNAVYNSQDSLSTFRNSILWSYDVGEIYNDPNFTPSTASSTYSMARGCMQFGAWNTAACGTDGGHNLVDADPRFTNPAAGFFELKVGSPVINRGNNSFISGYPYDLDSQARIANNTVDLGAYERQQSQVFIAAVKK